MALQEQLKQQGDFLFKYRSYFPLLFIALAFTAIAYRHQHSYAYSSTVLLISEFMQSIAIYVGLFGFLIRVYTIGFTPKNTSGRNTKEGQIADELNTKGLYSLTRNPLYVGNFFMWMGTVLFTVVIWFFVLFVFIFWLYYERIIYAEEVFLREKFGNNYLNWAEKTPIFIPNNLSYDHPIMTFDWKKIIIKEKTGLFMLFLVFFGFQLFSGFVITHFLVVEFNFITYGTIFSFVFYIVIKTMQSSKLFSVE
tara:strand:+ start:948 stop:1700 length:753 start_codon:yes stop_codon:yes gene_type:complete